MRDGPFADVSVAGFWLVRVESKDEAIEWMKRAPFGAGTVLELRQVFAAEDFGANFTDELRAREEGLRTTLAGQT